MRIKRTPKELIDKTKPHLWFAWHPVKTQHYWVWLETVSRVGHFQKGAAKFGQGSVWRYYYYIWNGE